MNTSNFWWEITLGIFAFLIMLRLSVQFKKLKARAHFFLALSYLPLSLYFFKEAFVPYHYSRYGNIDLMGGLIGISGFSLLSLMILIVVPKAQEKMGTLLRFPLAGLLLGTYVGEHFSWLSFLVVNLVLLGLFYLRKEDCKKLHLLQIISTVLALVSYFVSKDNYFVSSITLLLYFITSFKTVSFGLVGLVFRQEEET